MWTSPLLRLVWSSIFHLQPSHNNLQRSTLPPGRNNSNKMDLQLRKLRRRMLKRSVWDQCTDDAFKPNGWVRLRKGAGDKEHSRDDIKKSKSARSLVRVLRKREILRNMQNTGEQFSSSRIRALHQEMRKLIALSNAVFLDMKFCPQMKKSLRSPRPIRIQRMLKKRADGDFLRKLINLTHAIHQRLWLFRYLQQAVQFLFLRSRKSSTKAILKSKSQPPIVAVKTWARNSHFRLI